MRRRWRKLSKSFDTLVSLAFLLYSYSLALYSATVSACFYFTNMNEALEWHLLLISSLNPGSLGISTWKYHKSNEESEHNGFQIGYSLVFTIYSTSLISKWRPNEHEVLPNKDLHFSDRVTDLCSQFSHLDSFGHTWVVLKKGKELLQR